MVCVLFESRFVLFSFPPQPLGCLSKWDIVGSFFTGFLRPTKTTVQLWCVKRNWGEQILLISKDVPAGKVEQPEKTRTPQKQTTKPTNFDICFLSLVCYRSRDENHHMAKFIKCRPSKDKTHPSQSDAVPSQVPFHLHAFSLLAGPLDVRLRCTAFIICHLLHLGRKVRRGGGRFYFPLPVNEHQELNAAFFLWIFWLEKAKSPFSLTYENSVKVRSFFVLGGKLFQGHTCKYPILRKPHDSQTERTSYNCGHLHFFPGG